MFDAENKFIFSVQPEINTMTILERDKAFETRCEPITAKFTVGETIAR